MLGAILGDIIGSAYEVSPVKTKDFALFTPGSGFTDDTVLTVAVADTLMRGSDLVDTFYAYLERYPRVGWGRIFASWAKVKDPDPYNSWGNGAAMRVSPVAWFCQSLEEVLAVAERTAAVTHNHPDGIRSAQAVAGALFLARHGRSKAEIRAFAARTGGYDLDRTLAGIRPGYDFKVDAIFSVPEALIAFLESDGVEDAIRNAVSLGGDADTQGCIAGAIAEGFHGPVPHDLAHEVLSRLDDFLRERVIAFCAQHVVPRRREAAHGPA